MIAEKSHDTHYMHPDLNDALRAAFEGGDPKNLWVQKYYESQSGELWKASTNDKDEGIAILTNFEHASMLYVCAEIEETGSMDKFNWLIDSLQDIVEKRWNKKETIQIETHYYKDEYDLYGVNRSDFY